MLVLPIAGIASANNILISNLVAASPVATGGFTPRALRTRHTSRLTTFTTTMWMVSRAHRRAADGGFDTHVALTPGFAQFDITVISISNLTNGGVALLPDQANFA